MAKTVRKNGWKALALFLALVVVLGAAYGIGYGITGKANPVDWVKKEQPATGHEHVYENGVCTVCGANEPDSLYIAFTAQTSRNLLSATSGTVAPMSARAATTGDVMTVTATVRHADGTAVSDFYQNVIFEGVGEDFDKYFNLTSDGSTATVTCKKAFDGTRELKCTSVYDMDVSATYSMTYAQRPITLGVNFGAYDGGAGNVSVNGVFDGFKPTLKLSDIASVSNSYWNDNRIKFIDSIELSLGSVQNTFTNYRITLSLKEGLKAELRSKLSVHLPDNNFGTYAMGYMGANYNSVFNSNMVTAISQYELFKGLLFDGDDDRMVNLINYSSGQNFTTFVNTMINYSDGCRTALFDVSVEAEYTYGGSTTFNYDVYCDFCDISQITWNNNDGHIF